MAWNPPASAPLGLTLLHIYMKSLKGAKQQMELTRGQTVNLYTTAPKPLVGEKAKGQSIH
jgi:hypothetical protein